MTVTPGTAACCASVTVPMTVAVSWASSGTGAASSGAARRGINEHNLGIQLLDQMNTWECRHTRSSCRHGWTPGNVVPIATCWPIGILWSDMLRRMLRVVAIAVVLTVTGQGLAAAGCELICDGVESRSARSTGSNATGSKCHDAGSLQPGGVLAASESGCQHVLAAAAATADRASTSAHAPMRNAPAPEAVGVARDRSNPRSVQPSPPGRPACVTRPLRL